MFNSDGSGNTRSPPTGPAVALRRLMRLSFDMMKIFSFVGASVGSYAGWALGSSLFGLMSAFMLSFIGLGIGIYAGRRLAHF